MFVCLFVSVCLLECENLDDLLDVHVAGVGGVRGDAVVLLDDWVEHGRKILRYQESFYRIDKAQTYSLLVQVVK